MGKLCARSAMTSDSDTEDLLLGDEAVALGALHAGISASYAYPGTPATEIQEHLLRVTRGEASPRVAWCSNEKTAYEAALGVSFAGRRALCSMKHVGLNVAADPFINSALVPIGGGLVLAVADDPGMHSSQNEQDSRCLADFARVLCLEPADQQEAYAMTREAFDLSERFRIPVMVRLTTRLAHSRSAVRASSPRGENELHKSVDRAGWTLLPANARRQWRALLDRQGELAAYSESCPHSALSLSPDDRGLGVITAGIARSYYLEEASELGSAPSHLHIGAYPLPVEKIRALAERCGRLLVLEEGYPFIERLLRGLLPSKHEIQGKMSGHLPPDGELSPELSRLALGLPPRPALAAPALRLPARPPQLCKGCPHADSYEALKLALEGAGASLVTSDIGCYTLGALPPYAAIESCVCMGASIGMARGAADAGFRPVLAVIGDGTFLHSGIAPLIDAAARDADMTVVILDNETAAMTGGQPTMLPTSRLEGLIRALGVAPEHLHVVEAHPRHTERNAAILRREMEHRGLSVVIAVRECLEIVKRRRRGGEEPA